MEPDPDSYVHGIALNGSSVYLVGDFLNVGGHSRSSVAAFEP